MAIHEINTQVLAGGGYEVFLDGESKVRVENETQLEWALLGIRGAIRGEGADDKRRAYGC